MKKKQIIFVAGIFTSKWNMSKWKRILETKFKDQDIVMIGENYNSLDTKKIKKILKQGISLIDNKKETILIGHSMGGILANAIANNSKNHKIKQIITIASPHKSNILGIKKVKKTLNYSPSLSKKIKTNTFGGYLDLLVPFKWSSMEHSMHKNLIADHNLLFLFNEKTINKIINQSIK